VKSKLESMLLSTLRESIEKDQLLRSLEENFYEFKIFSNVDSISLVSILIDFEGKIQDELGVTVLISSERAMSARGPFYNVESLLKFTQELIDEEVQ